MGSLVVETPQEDANAKVSFAEGTKWGEFDVDFDRMELEEQTTDRYRQMRALKSIIKKAKNQDDEED